MRWNVSQFVLDPVVIGQHPPAVSFACQTVEQLPAEFSYAKSWDEAIVPTLTEHASLLVRGLSPETLAQLTEYTSLLPSFSYELSFADQQTGEERQFHITSEIDTPERGTSRFGLPFDEHRDVPTAP